MTVLRTFQEWPERDFRPVRDGLPIVTARDGAGMRFSADADTTQGGGMALVNPLKAWRLKGEVSASLSAPRLFRVVRKHGKIIEKGVFGVAEHNIGTILSPSTGTGIRISRNDQ